MSKERKAFNFYRSYYDTGKMLSDKDRLLFYDALLEKQFNGIDTELKGNALLAWVGQKHSIESQIKGWEDKTGVKLSDNHATEPPTEGGSEGPTEPPLYPPSVQGEEKGKGQEKEKEQLRLLLKDSIWCNDEFYNSWFRWKKYKKVEFQFSYKGEDSEATALRQLWKVSGGKQEIAIQIIDKSIGKGWSGLFKLDEENGKTQQTNTSRLGEGNHDGKEYKL